MRKKVSMVLILVLILGLAYYAYILVNKKAQLAESLNNDETAQTGQQNQNPDQTQDQTQNETGDINYNPIPEELPNLYTNDKIGFSSRYPDGYTVKSDYKYQELGPGKDISGVAFVIPESLASGTNLSADSYFSVETIPGATDCSANLFLDMANGLPATTTLKDGLVYSFASSTGAGAGNRYEESVYAMPGTNPCLAARYFIHYGVLENYPEGAVKEFDRVTINKQFDAMLLSVSSNQ
ncbi:MAG: hypothetical protein WC467_03420 [Patescibacteria group bacterium]